MIKNITVINDLNEVLTIELGAPEKTGLWVKSLKGIGPGKASINTTDLASSDGGVYNSARAETRNITLTLGILSYTHPTEIDPATGHLRTVSVEETRRKTYKWFAKKKPITFIIKTDMISLVAYGYVESNEPDIFNKQQTESISIICPDPNWYLYNSTSGLSFSATDNIFEFPMYFFVTQDSEFVEGKTYYELINGIYTITEDETKIPLKTYYEENIENEGYSNEGFFITSDTEFDPGKTYYELDGSVYVVTSDVVMDPEKTYYEFDEYYANTILADILLVAQKDVQYVGEVNVGVTISMNLTSSVSGLILYETDNVESYIKTMTIDDEAINRITGGYLSEGDYLEICTVKGNRYAFLTRNAETFNIMNSLGKNPGWFELKQGDNSFSYIASEGMEDVILDISFVEAYEGV